MASGPLELADRLWEGDERIEDHHPVGYSAPLCEVGDGVAFVPSLGNVSAFQTGAGLVLVDTGGYLLAPGVHEQVRGWSELPLHTAIYSHGHVDHVFGAPLFDAEAAASGRPAPRVVAHENVPARFDRYRATAGYNGAINARQFRLPELRFPTDFRYPDETYRSELALEVAGERFELHHAKGETDDHTWTWVPGRRILCCGDLFIWATPNAGNPQKAQRYPREWAAALREMAELGAELMLPGHGPPVAGAERVRAALSDTAALLESLCEQTLALMNEGAPLERILREVRPPPELIGKPYLRPVYDEPEFIVRNLWRLYGGWYEGDPARLKPAPRSGARGGARRPGGGRRAAGHTGARAGRRGGAAPGRPSRGAGRARGARGGRRARGPRGRERAPRGGGGLDDGARGLRLGGRGVAARGGGSRPVTGRVVAEASRRIAEEARP